jgi:YD repeat-containing protein
MRGTPENQLVAINGPISASFSYDGTGRRRSKTINGATTSFQYDGIKPVQERTATAVVNLLHGPASINSLPGRTARERTLTSPMRSAPPSP